MERVSDPATDEPAPAAAIRAPATPARAPAAAARAPHRPAVAAAAGALAWAGFPPALMFPGQWVRPQGCGCGGGDGGCSCGGAAGSSVGYVYAVGTITARFPNQSVEREFLQAWGNPNYNGSIGNRILYEVLSRGENLYLARSMCWVFQNSGMDIYLLQPRSQVELTELIMSLNDPPGEITFDLIIGIRGPAAPPNVCNGLQLPIVVCDQVFSFTYNQFINSILQHSGSDNGGKPSIDQTAATNAFDVLNQLSGNSGATDEYRAINYLTYKSLDVYVKEAEMEAINYTLTSVTAQPSQLSQSRSMIDVIFTYTSQAGMGSQQYFARVDVTGEFPFLMTSIARFFDHP